MKINNRRYIGCKTKLVDIIYKVVQEKGYDNKNSFADLFAGTGVVGGYFANRGYSVLFNDTLYSNYIIYNAFFSNETINMNIIRPLLEEYNKLESGTLTDNYFSNAYGNKYYSVNDAKKIGYIRDNIEEIRNKLNFREYCYLITSLIYAIDRTANTVGHFESYLSKKTIDRGIQMSELDVSNLKNHIEIFNIDANKLAKEIKYDVVYIDPPYNARQYVNFYHVLENLARWNKPTEFEGASMKFKRNELKSDYCRNQAPTLFAELINSLKCKLIIVSYNNTYEAKSISSINKITEKQIMDTLNKVGTVEKKEIDFSAFNAGKTNLENHKEFLYICEVK